MFTNFTTITTGCNKEQRNQMLHGIDAGIALVKDGNLDGLALIDSGLSLATDEQSRDLLVAWIDNHIGDLVN